MLEHLNSRIFWMLKCYSKPLCFIQHLQGITVGWGPPPPSVNLLIACTPQTSSPKSWRWRIRGLPYITSANFSDFLTPLSLSQISWFCSFNLLLGTPHPPTHCRRHIWKPPCRSDFPAFPHTNSTSLFVAPRTYIKLCHQVPVLLRKFVG